MIQRIVQVLLLITLVGQNFISPALAMHDLLHTIDTTGEKVILSSSDTLDNSTTLTSGSLQPSSIYLSSAISSGSNQSTSDSSGSNQSLADFSGFKCAEACTMLASGHCISHCVSLIGIFIEPGLKKYRPGRSPQNSVALWSAQTTDSSPVYRPPIA